MTARVEWIDVARGVGILLVVFGHVVAGVIAAGLAGDALPALSAVNRFVYTFHMPVFVVAAGLFATRSALKPPAAFWADKFGTLAYPYVVWAVAQTAVHLAFRGHSNTPAGWGRFAEIAYAPPMQFWFLYNLFLWFVLYRAVVRMGGGPVAFAAAAVGLALALHLLDVSATSVPGRTRDNLPLFALGVVAAGGIRRASDLPVAALAAVTAVGYGATVGLLLTGVALPWPIYYLAGLPGVAATVAGSVLLARWRPALLVLGGVGRRSLEIYVAHVIAYVGARVALLKALGVTDAATHLVVGTAAGVCGPLALAALADAMRLPYLFRWPARPQPAPVTP